MSSGYGSDAIPSRRLARLGPINTSDIGRGRPGSPGRQDDSSSSRESSPLKKQRRSASVTSDDATPSVPPVEDDDTPPPEGPLLRQAVAFSSATAPARTYQATFPSNPNSSRPIFLPGQEVPSSTTAPQRPPQTQKKTRNTKGKGKTRHFNDKFSDHTGSFRLKGYVNEPNVSSVHPPTHFGTGPYSSMYRAAIQETRPPPPPGPSRSSTSSGDDKFSNKTGSFQLRGYVNDPNAPSVNPPTYYGSGPYSSLYRASVQEARTSDISRDSATGGNVHSNMTSTWAPPSTSMSATSNGTSSRPDQPAFSNNTNTAPGRPATANPNAHSSIFGTTNTIQASSSNPISRVINPNLPNRKSTLPPQHNLDRHHSPRTSGCILEQHRPTPLGNTNASYSGETSHYYRRDYDNHRDLAPRVSSHFDTHSPPGFYPRFTPSDPIHTSPTPSMSETVVHPTSPNPPDPISHVSSARGRLDNPVSGNSNDNKTSDADGAARPLRMVTILIEDIRSGVSDHQLAEVKIALRSADDPGDGFWADAKDLSAALQTSPSRIDGPAKVYTLRGKYRQFFLRVSADNVDDISSANIIITKQRTLDIVVEPYHPPDGSLPLPPKIPYRLTRTPTPEAECLPSPATAFQTAQQDVRSRPSPDRGDYHYASARKRGRSSQSDIERPGQDSRSDPHSNQHHIRPRASSSSPSPTVRSTPLSYSTSSNAPPKKRKSHGKSASFQEGIKISSVHSRHIRPHEEYDYPKPGSPQPGATPEQINAAIWKAVQADITQDEEWLEFMKSKASPSPHKLADVLKQYRFVQRKVDEWEGRPAPFKSSRHIVHKSHVLDALYMDEKWGADCTETLQLLDMYGPNGERYVDARVVDLLQDESASQRGRPAKKLLRLLRQVDKDWAADAEEEEDELGAAESAGEQGPDGDSQARRIRSG